MSPMKIQYLSHPHQKTTQPTRNKSSPLDSAFEKCINMIIPQIAR